MYLRPRSRTTLSDAIAYLASACDGAQQRDGHGFNADHVPIGHRLVGANRWSRRDRRRARQFVRYYRRQLSAAGFDVDAVLRGRRPRRRSRRFRSQNPPQWAVDPTGVQRLRFWNGTRWTHLVSGHDPQDVIMSSPLPPRAAATSARWAERHQLPGPQRVREHLSWLPGGQV